MRALAAAIVLLLSAGDLPALGAGQPPSQPGPLSDMTDVAGSTNQQRSYAGHYVDTNLKTQTIANGTNITIPPNATYLVGDTAGRLSAITGQPAANQAKLAELHNPLVTVQGAPLAGSKTVNAISAFGGFPDYSFGNPGPSSITGPGIPADTGVAPLNAANLKEKTITLTQAATAGDGVKLVTLTMNVPKNGKNPAAGHGMSHLLAPVDNPTALANATNFAAGKGPGGLATHGIAVVPGAVFAMQNCGGTTCTVGIPAGTALKPWNPTGHCTPVCDGIGGPAGWAWNAANHNLTPTGSSVPIDGWDFGATSNGSDNNGVKIVINRPGQIVRNSRINYNCNCGAMGGGNANAVNISTGNPDAHVYQNEIFFDQSPPYNPTTIPSNLGTAITVNALGAPPPGPIIEFNYVHDASNHSIDFGNTVVVQYNHLYHAGFGQGVHGDQIQTGGGYYSRVLNNYMAQIDSSHPVHYKALATQPWPTNGNAVAFIAGDTDNVSRIDFENNFVTGGQFGLAWGGANNSQVITGPGKPFWQLGGIFVGNVVQHSFAQPPIVTALTMPPIDTLTAASIAGDTKLRGLKGGGGVNVVFTLTAGTTTANSFSLGISGVSNLGEVKPGMAVSDSAGCIPPGSYVDRPQPAVTFTNDALKKATCTANPDSLTFSALTGPVVSGTGNISTSTNSITNMSTLAGIQRGMYINMPGIPPRASIQSITNTGCPAGCSVTWSNGNGNLKGTTNATGVTYKIMAQYDRGMTVTGSAGQAMPKGDVIIAINASTSDGGPSITLATPPAGSASGTISIIPNGWAVVSGNFDYASGTSIDYLEGGPLP